MKKIIIYCISALFTLNSFAQNAATKASDRGRISLAAYVPEQVDNLPEGARNMLENKLHQIISQNGFGGDAGNQRFIIAANIVTLSKDMLSTAPPMTALTLEVNLYIGDGFEGTKFASTTVSVKGVGENETKAYVNAFKNISIDNEKMQAFVTSGKSKIINYYNTKCDVILKKAQAMVAMGNPGEAIYTLTSVPEVCKTCYDRSMAQVGPIYKKQIEKDCATKLAQARNVWTASQDLSGANAASELLSQIDPQATCYNEVKSFVAQMGKRVKELDNREWNFKLREQKNDADIIKSARDVAVAYATHQPNTIVSYNVRGWW